MNSMKIKIIKETWAKCVSEKAFGFFNKQVQIQNQKLSKSFKNVWSSNIVKTFPHTFVRENNDNMWWTGELE